MEGEFLNTSEFFHSSTDSIEETLDSTKIIDFH